ncbi:MAG: DNA-processing protein DprA [Fimbriimonadaceae bacterium]|nr:DNA-processing protein DprA [Fimbriimonadaceae bacterium]QYK56027.1 MAG: DNA-processing protein DprA [Fimbriimonadaceae bacterium]
MAEGVAGQPEAARPSELSAAFWSRILAAELGVEQASRAAAGASSSPDPEAFLLAWPGASERQRQAMAAHDATAAERALLGGAEVLFGDRLPSLLLRAPSPPPAVFVDGDLRCLDRPMVAIVGTRTASTYGLAMARRFAGELAQAGATVVSGGAVGIDRAAHEAAMEAGGATLAVLPCGVDVVYPSRHAQLYAKIRERGALMSRYPCGVGPKKHWIPGRNSVVAGLCRAVILVEVPSESGALITAKHAREAGRTTFVVPGPANQPSFVGSHALIRRGAVLADDPGQVLRSLGLQASPGQEFDPSAFGGDEAAVFGALVGQPLSVEKLAESTGLAPGRVLSALTILELEGAIVRATEGYARAQ